MRMISRTMAAGVGLAMALAGVSCKRQEMAEAAPAAEAGGTGVEALMKFRGETRQHYNNSRFAELEEIATRVRAGKERLGDGEWKIYHFYQALECRKEEPESMWKLHERLHLDWIRRFPESMTAQVAQADFLVTYAWHARTDKVAANVTEEGWKLFRERLAEARKVLDEAKRLSPACPMWWKVRQTVALGQAWPRAEYDALFKEAKAFEPEFFEYDFSRAKYLLPRWHGEPGDWEKAAVDQIALQGVTGSEIYARLVTEMAEYYGNVFSESEASWRKARVGYEDWRKRYPGSAEVLNRYCRQACFAGDREQAKKLFDEIGGNEVPTCWRKNEFAKAKAWAVGKSN